MQGRRSSQLGREGAHKPHWELLPATMLDHSYMLALKPRAQQELGWSVWVIPKAHPLHPGVLQDLGSAQPLLGISDQQLGDEVFGSKGDVGPVLVRELILPLLDALKQHVLGAEVGESHPKTDLAPFRCLRRVVGR